MRNVTEKKICIENQNTHFGFSKGFSFFFFFKNSGIYDIMWKKILVERAGHR
jgi:predicted 3-demethylubiquinone-9 3-methyltransferase (glyoxalase superfamily)